MGELTPKGYRVPYSDDEFFRIKRELTVKPLSLPDFDFGNKSFPVYRKSDKYIYVPKHYGLDRYGTPSRIREHNTEDINIEFNGKLRPKQEEIVGILLDHLKTKESAILCVGCGQGKTVLSLWLACMLGKKTMVLVHKEFLLNQWIERIKQFLPTARIGILQQNTIDVQDKDIVIAMVQSIVSRDYPVDVYDGIGFLALDESHHMCSRMFSKALYYVRTKYMLGLSATPYRKDGLTKVLKWFMGDIIEPEVDEKDYKPSVRMVKAVYGSVPEIKYNVMGKINRPNLITQIADDDNRNIQIVDIVDELYDEGRKILVLSERRGQCFKLCDILVGRGRDCGVYVGGMDNESLEESNGRRIILATYSMCSEGYDNKEIDTLVMATGRSDIEQSVGRILRQKNANTPLVVDIYDELEGMKGQIGARKRFYRRNGYDIIGSKVSKRIDFLD